MEEKEEDDSDEVKEKGDNIDVDEGIHHGEDPKENTPLLGENGRYCMVLKNLKVVCSHLPPLN